jgi:hypothetical protein
VLVESPQVAARRKGRDPYLTTLGGTVELYSAKYFDATYEDVIEGLFGEHESDSVNVASRN